MPTDHLSIERSLTAPTEAVWEALGGHVSPLQGWLESRRAPRYIRMRSGLRLELAPAIRAQSFEAPSPYALSPGAGAGGGSGVYDSATPTLLLLQVRRLKRLRPRAVDVVMERGIYALDPVELADWHDQTLADFARLEEANQALTGDVERGGLLASLALAGAYDGRLPATVLRRGERGLERALPTRRDLIERVLDLGVELRPERAKLLDAAVAHINT